MASITRTSALLALVPALALSGTALVAGSASAAGPTISQASATTKASKSTPGKRVYLTVTGDTLGQKARVKLKGVKGKAKGYKKTVKITNGKTKKVKRLKSGKYKVIAKKITSGSDSAVGTASPRKVKVKASRGGSSTLTYVASSASAGQGSGQPSGQVTGPTNLQIADVMIGGKEQVKATWNAATGKTVKTYRVYYSQTSGSGPWSQQDPPEDYTQTSFSYDVCSNYPLFSGQAGWGYLTAVFTDGTESAPSNVVYYKLEC